MIAPGRWADVLLVQDLMDFHADVVIARGQVIAEGTPAELRANKWVQASNLGKLA